MLDVMKGGSGKAEGAVFAGKSHGEVRARQRFVGRRGKKSENKLGLRSTQFLATMWRL